MTKSKKPDGYDATIREVFVGKEDHGIDTVYIRLEHDGGSWQSFGDVCLDGGELTKDFVRSVCAIFRTTDLESLKGRRCRALYNFTSYNEPIAGLETDEGRFTTYSWCKKHFPDTQHPLQAKRDSIEMHIASSERRVRELREELQRIESKFVELD